MSAQQIPKGVLQARAKLNRRLKKARDAFDKASQSLSKVIDVYNKKHNEALKLNRPVASKTHEKMVNGITKARTKLAAKLDQLLEIENEWKDYFRKL
jgi:uncharacterized phage infection (PIP) family protein YhgE